MKKDTKITLHAPHNPNQETAIPLAYVHVKVAGKNISKLAFKEHLKKAKGNRGRPKPKLIRQIYNDLKPINKTQWMK